MSQSITFGNLTVEITQNGDQVTYRFAGDVDENFKQKEVPRINGKTITLMLEGITNFNSCGIREWIYLVRDLEKCGQLMFTKCSIPMIDQINMVPDSLGTGIIDSFYAPYFCSSHGEASKLIQMKDCLPQLMARTAPQMKCDTCNSILEFDALEASYFMFVSGNLSKAS